MAFPNDSLRKTKVTIDSGNIAAALSGFPIQILLADVPSDMMDAGVNSCLNGGGDIRAGNADGSVRYPLEVVRCVTNASAASRELELHVKVTGSISSSSDTDVWLYYDEAGATQPAASSTYGSEKVWDTDYELVSHDGAKTNSTSGSNPSVFTTEPSAGSGKEDDTDARDYGSRTETEGYTLGITGTTEYTFEHQIYSRSVDNNAELSFYRLDFVGFTSERYGYQYNDEFWLTDGTNYLGGTLANITEDTWHMVSLAQDGGSDGEIYVDGSSVYSGSALSAPDTAETTIAIGVAGNGTSELDGLVGEVRYSKVRRADAWINATADMINDHSNFYNHTPASESTATNVEVTATVGNVTATTTNATVQVQTDTNVTATVGNVSVTKTNATVLIETDTNVTATVGNVSVSKQNATILVETDTNVTATQGNVTVAGTNATVQVQRDVIVTATVGNVTVSKQNTSVVTQVDTIVQATTSEVSVETTNAAVSVGSDTNVVATVGEVTITGTNATVQVGRDYDLTVTTGEVTVSKQNVSVSVGADTNVVATTGDVVIESDNATVFVGVDLAIVAGTGDVTATTTNVTVQVEVDTSVTATTAAVAVTKANTNVIYVPQWNITASTSNVEVTKDDTQVVVPDAALLSRTSRLYSNFIDEFNANNIDLVTDLIKIIPVGEDYEFNFNHTYLSDLGANTVSVPVTLTGNKWISNGNIFKYGERKISFQGVVGTVAGFALYKDTGDASTSPLISFHKEDFKGLTKGLDSELLEWVLNTGGFFEVEPEDVYVGRTVSYTDITPRSNIRN